MEKNYKYVPLHLKLENFIPNQMKYKKVRLQVNIYEKKTRLCNHMSWVVKGCFFVWRKPYRLLKKTLIEVMKLFFHSLFLSTQFLSLPKTSLSHNKSSNNSLIITFNLVYYWKEVRPTPLEHSVRWCGLSNTTVLSWRTCTVLAAANKKSTPFSLGHKLKNAAKTNHGDYGNQFGSNSGS